MVAFAFNAQQFEPKYSGGSSLPPGKYKGVIVNSETKPTDKGDGGYLALEIQVIEGPLSGQKQIGRLNLHNTNPKTVEIANKQMSAYCHVLGVYQVQDTQQLHNIPFQFEVRQQKNNPDYTEIGAIWDINGCEPGKQGQAPAQPVAQPQPAFAPPAQVAPAAPAPAWAGQAPAAPAAAPAWAPGAPTAPAAPAAPAWAPGAPTAPAAPAAPAWAPGGAAPTGDPAPSWAQR